MQESEHESARTAASRSDTTPSPKTRSIIGTLLQDVVADNLAASPPQQPMLSIHSSGELEALPHDIALVPNSAASDFQDSGEPVMAAVSACCSRLVVMQTGFLSVAPHDVSQIDCFRCMFHLFSDHGGL